MNKSPAPESLIAGITRVAARLEAGLARAVEDASGLTLAQLSFLRCVQAGGGALSLGGVAERLSCAKSNATQLADRLEAQRLIVRSPDPADGRCVRALLTAEGRLRLAAGESARCAAAAALLGNVPAAELEELVALLDRVRTAAGGEDGVE